MSSKLDSRKIIFDAQHKTINKNKIVEQFNKNSELKKYFAVTDGSEEELNKKLELKVKKLINANIKKYDIVLALDFGHGFFTKEILEIIQKKSNFLSVNCQTNSLNYGYNIITSKYKKVNCFSLDKTEINLSQKNNYSENYEKKLSNLRNKLKSKYGFLTLGQDYTLGINNKNQLYKVKTLTNNVIDTVGAGDAFFSICSLCSFLNLNLNYSTFMSQLAGAVHVNHISNKNYIDRSKLINFFKNIY